MKLILTVGVSASGKTTWRNQVMNDEPGEWVVVERDEIRNEIKQQRGLNKWNLKYEKDCVRIQEERIREAASRSDIKGVIVSDTNLVLSTRQRLWNLGISCQMVVEEKPFPISFDDACARDAKRCNGVGAFVIGQQYELWTRYMEERSPELLDYRPYVPNQRLPPAFIFDLDGTLAHMWNRSAYDWAKVGDDTLDIPVSTVFKSLSFLPFTMIVVSGRDSCCRSETEDWLKRHHLFDNVKLFMREKGDMRKDTLVKHEIFWNHIAEHYYVVGVFDDRPVVCDQWRKMGIKVFQVGNPYHRF